MKNKKEISVKDLAMVAATIYDGDARKSVEDALLILSHCDESLAQNSKQPKSGSPQIRRSQKSFGTKLGADFYGLPESIENKVKKRFTKTEDRQEALAALEKLNESLVEKEINPAPPAEMVFPSGDMVELLQEQERIADFKTRRDKALDKELEAIRQKKTSKSRSEAGKKSQAKKKAEQRRKAAKKKTGS